LQYIDPRWGWTVAIVVSGLVLSWLIGYLGRTLNEGRFRWQQTLRGWLGVAPGKELGELGWLFLAVQLLLWPLATWKLLQVWGLSEIGESLREHLTRGGLHIGSVQIVPAQLLLGLFWFALLFTFTRRLKRKIELDWLPKTHVEPSTRDSVATLFGYATFVVAAIVGLSVAGLDFSKLAIVAGALSVGIGFGLQNIVNNFVSGLIILFERPVRTGDYITVNGNEGFVRRIRIRSTEIETVGRESIVVPNSDLLSNAVANLNLRDNVGRITVAVGVAYGSDTRRVRELLLEVASRHEVTIKAGELPDVPGPQVLFTNFGDSSLDFELRVFIHFVERRFIVASDLRFEIDDSFRRNGISIPFPQRDLWLKQMPAPIMDAADQVLPGEDSSGERA